MEHFLRGRRFESFEEVEEACQEFFNSKEPEWYPRPDPSTCGTMAGSY
jgi:hypothetical protein